MILSTVDGVVYIKGVYNKYKMLKSRLADLSIPEVPGHEFMFPKVRSHGNKMAVVSTFFAIHFHNLIGLNNNLCVCPIPVGTSEV